VANRCLIRAIMIKRRMIITQNTMKKICFGKKIARQANTNTQKKRTIYKSKAVSKTKSQTPQTTICHDLCVRSDSYETASYFVLNFAIALCKSSVNCLNVITLSAIFSKAFNCSDAEAEISSLPAADCSTTALMLSTFCNT
jgi:hypothetical protein